MRGRHATTQRSFERSSTNTFPNFLLALPRKGDSKIAVAIQAFKNGRQFGVVVGSSKAAVFPGTHDSVDTRAADTGTPRAIALRYTIPSASRSLGSANTELSRITRAAFIVSRLPAN